MFRGRKWSRLLSRNRSYSRPVSTNSLRHCHRHFGTSLLPLSRPSWPSCALSPLSHRRCASHTPGLISAIRSLDIAGPAVSWISGAPAAFDIPIYYMNCTTCEVIELKRSSERNVVNQIEPTLKGLSPRLLCLPNYAKHLKVLR